MPREQVVATNDDAVECKQSAVTLGYWKDPFISFFLTHNSSHNGKVVRKPPLINRGHYFRVAAIDCVIKHFLTALNGRQVVVLGAGFDTTFFRLLNSDTTTAQLMASGAVKWVELDLPEVTQHKVNILKSHIQSFVPSSSSSSSSSTIDLTVFGNNSDEAEIKSLGYSLRKCDLTQPTDEGLDQAVLKLAGVSCDLPVLVISECVLVYLEAAQGDHVIQWVSSRFPQAMFLTYEQVTPNDPFGRQMVANLQERGCPLLSLASYPTLQAQKQRYVSRGWSSELTEVSNMSTVARQLHAKQPQEARRVAKLEIFDEFEEWELIMCHYCLVVAVNDTRASHWFPSRLSLASHLPY